MLREWLLQVAEPAVLLIDGPALIVIVGAIAVIRTFPNYFLERDFVEVHEQQEQAR
jgi:uncharacterized membrane protein